MPIFRRAPAVLDEAGPDQPLLVRGDFKNPAAPVPRRYLDALGGELYDDPATTRLRLAEDVADPRNPLTARVMVNRIWRHLLDAAWSPPSITSGVWGARRLIPNCWTFSLTDSSRMDGRSRG